MPRLRHYNRIGGFWNIPDDDIEGLFRRMKIEASYYIVHPDVYEDGYATYYCVPCGVECCW